MINKKMSGIGISLLAMFYALPAFAVPVDLSTWIVDGNGNWTLSSDNNSVFQSLNSAPIVFHNGIDSQGTLIAGTLLAGTQFVAQFFLTSNSI